MAKPKPKWPRILAMVLVVVLLAGSLSLVLVDKLMPEQTYIPSGLVTFPSRVVAAVLKPFQSTFTWAANGVSGYLESWKLSKTIEIAYNELRAQNESYIYDTLYVKKLEDDLERYEKLLGLKAEFQTQNPVAARVISKETGNWFQTFTIDKGKNDGIKDLMAVINTDGLIGYISTVEDTSSEVITIIDSRARVAGLLESSRDQGMVQGTLGLDEEASCRMYYLPTNSLPRPGERVITSGMGEPFPKGIAIGEVRESTRHIDDNKQYVVIDPYVDFQHIEEVMVLVYTPSQEDTVDSDDGQLTHPNVDLDTPRPSPIIGDAVEDPLLGAITPPPRDTRDTIDGFELGDDENAVYGDDGGNLVTDDTDDTEDMEDMDEAGDMDGDASTPGSSEDSWWVESTPVPSASPPPNAGPTTPSDDLPGDP